MLKRFNILRRCRLLHLCLPAILAVTISTCTTTSENPASPEPTQYEFVYPTALGTKWIYQSSFVFGEHGQGQSTTYIGTRTWQVVSSTRLGDTTTCRISSIAHDSVRFLWIYPPNSNNVLRDSSYVIDGVTAFQLVITPDSISTWWPTLVREVPIVSVLSLPRFSKAKIDTAQSYFNGDLFPLAKYVNGVGLVSYHDAREANNYWSEGLYLLSLTQAVK